MLARNRSLGIALGLGMLAFAAVTVRPNNGLASTITLISIDPVGTGGAVYEYGVALAGGETVDFNQNQTITFSGLSGVTAAFVPGASGFGSIGFAVSSFTSTSVVFVETETGQFLGALPDSPVTPGALEIQSSLQTTGSVNFSMETGNEGTISGTVQGPVNAAVPEPASIALLGGGLLGLGIMLRRRNRA